jgi:GTP-binding protein
MHVRGEYTHAVFSIPARGLIGLRTRLLNATQGTAIIHHRFRLSAGGGRGAAAANGVLVSMVGGRAVAYAWTRCRSGPTCSSRRATRSTKG